MVSIFTDQLCIMTDQSVSLPDLQNQFEHPNTADSMLPRCLGPQNAEHITTYATLVNLKEYTSTAMQHKSQYKPADATIVLHGLQKLQSIHISLSLSTVACKRVSRHKVTRLPHNSPGSSPLGPIWW